MLKLKTFENQSWKIPFSIGVCGIRVDPTKKEQLELRHRAGMAGRHHPPPPKAVNLREAPPSRSNPAIGDHRLLLHHAQPPAGLEDCIAIQHREIQTLLIDNQRLAATHVALKQELAASQQELAALSAAAATAKTERDAQVREVYERSLKTDAEARLVDAIIAELDQVRGDVQKLGASRKELAAELRVVEEDAARARDEAKQVPSIKADTERLRREIQRGR